ncbi:glycosyl transferase family 1 [Arachidicoccus ginsenosidimutans]|uniref:DUF1972 domain-containing protein n=1 Tax=Arachidicoccus sp. BS20 TaxID=1850526 RepID=UPI0007F07457|nr:DUF1972 domain-containing protein [Arachidicoccus sp. BS20]ANI88865.1 glycosyl transferase family 1 [Arachidicoccus sp. BS20]
MNIAIIGTRGIPNYYGGFEQFAEYLSLGLIKQGYSVTVYNSHTHPYQQKEWKGVQIIHCKDPEDKYGTAGQFVYDLNCIKDTRKRNYDIILQLGYTSSSIWGWLLPRKKSIVTTNMDGLEWKRTKYSKKVQKFLQYAEKLGVKYSDYLISDSVGIQQYLKNKYGADSEYIPYGATLFVQPDKSVLDEYNVGVYHFNMLIARLEPENSIETILDGVAMQKNDMPFLVVGKHETKYGAYLKDKFGWVRNIRFLNGIYDINKLNNLRHYSNLYFHGHTVGGTNPSLLEAMASQALICANDNIFNKSILETDAYYFSDADEVAQLLNTITKSSEGEKILNNEKKIESTYAWDIITQQYIEHFNKIIE